MNKDVLKKIFWMVFTFVLSILTIWVVIQQSNSMSLEYLMRKIAHADIRWIVVAMLSAACYVLFEAVALWAILKGIGIKTHLRNGLLYSTADVYFSAVTPSATGGQPASAYFMLKDGISAGVTSATLILNLMMYNSSIVFLGILAVIMNPDCFFGFHLTSKILIILGFIGLTLLSLFFFLLFKGSEKIFAFIRKVLIFLFNKKLIHRLETKMKKLEKIESDYANCSELISGRTDIMVKAFIYNVLQRASQIIVPAWVFTALGGKLNMAGLLFSKQCLITIGYNYVPIPGALGIADYLMIDGFSGIMAKDAAFELDMISRGMSFYICVTISGIITLIGYLKRRAK